MPDFDWEDIKISGGPEIVNNSDVLLLYKVALSEYNLENGILIESTYNPDIPVSVTVNEEALLLGVYKGILGMHGGGSVRRIVIPPDMAFGNRGFGRIPPNAYLYVEICIVSVDNDFLGKME